MPLYSQCRTYLFRIPTTCAVKKGGQGKPILETGWPSGTNWDAAIRNMIADPYATTIINIVRTLSDDDLKVRAARMMAAMHLSIQYDVSSFGGMADSDQTLRLFVAPEFYFRSETAYYYTDTCNELMRALDEFLRSYNDPSEDRIRVKNWLFLLGTIVYRVAVARVRRILPKNELVSFFVGDDGIPKRRLVQKFVASNIDGPDRGNWYSSVRAVACGSWEAGLKHYFSDAGVFVEICLEHFDRVMLQVVERYRLPFLWHVICAAGMLVITNNTFIGTRVFRSDGAVQGQMAEGDDVGEGVLYPRNVNLLFDLSALWQNVPLESTDQVIDARTERPMGNEFYSIVPDIWLCM